MREKATGYFTEGPVGFASLRTYAIFGMNRLVFLVILALALINPAISIVSPHHT